MALDNADVIAYLSENYMHSLARRALWQWAGGRQSEVDYGDDGWAAMWGRACAGSGAARIAIVRQALFDHPGEARLLGFLDALAAEISEDWRETAQLFTTLLEQTAPDFPHAKLLSLLLAFPEKPVDEAFAVVTSSMQGLFDDPQRELLESHASLWAKQGIAITSGAVARSMILLLKAIPKIVGMAAVHPYHDVAGMLFAPLERIAHPRVPAVFPATDETGHAATPESDADRDKEAPAPRMDPASGRDRTEAAEMRGSGVAGGVPSAETFIDGDIRPAVDAALLKAAVAEMFDPMGRLPILAGASEDPILKIAVHRAEQLYAFMGMAALGKALRGPAAIAAATVQALWATRGAQV